MLSTVGVSRGLSRNNTKLLHCSGSNQSTELTCLIASVTVGFGCAVAVATGGSFVPGCRTVSLLTVHKAVELDDCSYGIQFNCETRLLRLCRHRVPLLNFTYGTVKR